MAEPTAQGKRLSMIETLLSLVPRFLLPLWERMLRREPQASHQEQTERLSSGSKTGHLICIEQPMSSWNYLESVRKHQAGLQSFRSMRRIEASRRNASALRLRFSQSLASLRQRLSQAKVRSTTQRRGSTTNPFVRSERLTISVSSCGKIFAKAF